MKLKRDLMFVHCDCIELRAYPDNFMSEALFFASRPTGSPRLLRLVMFLDRLLKLRS